MDSLHHKQRMVDNIGTTILLTVFGIPILVIVYGLMFW